METKTTYSATVEGTTILEAIQVVACLAGVVVLVVAAVIDNASLAIWAAPLFAAVFAARLAQMGLVRSTLELEFTYTSTRIVEIVEG